MGTKTSFILRRPGLARGISLFLALALLLSLMGLALIPTAAGAAVTPTGKEKITLYPDSGRVDKKMKVEGKKFEDDEKVDIYFSEVRASVGDKIGKEEKVDIYEKVKSGIKTKDGDWDVNFNVPDELTDGKKKRDIEKDDYYVYVTYADENVIVAKADFEVTGTKGGGDGDLRLDPDEGPIGQKVEARGKDLDEYEDEYVYLYFTDEDLDEGDDWDIEDIDHCEYLGKVEVDDDAEFKTTFTVPDEMTDGDEDEDVEEGKYYVVVVDDKDEGEVLAVADFRVTRPKGKIALSPNTGIVGTAITVSGADFATNSSATIYYDGASLGSKATGSAGSFIFTFNAPEGAAGAHLITARDGKGGEGEATFTVSPDLILSPSRGAPGSPLQFTGSGFGKGLGVTILLGATTVGSATANANGSFKANIETPRAPGGSQALTARDTAGNTKTVSLFITPTLTVNPRQVNVGSQLAVSGAGFGANQGVTITYDGTRLGQATADASGSFTATFAVPKSPGGDHRVAVEPQGDKIEAIVTMETAPPPAPQVTYPSSGQSMGTFGSGVLTLQWSEVTDPSGVSYVVQLARSGDFSQPLLNMVALTSPQYTLVDGLRAGSYYLRVKAIDGASNESNWSAIVPFRVGTFPAWLSLWLFIVLVIIAIVIIGGIVWLVLQPKV